MLSLHVPTYLEEKRKNDYYGCITENDGFLISKWILEKIICGQGPIITLIFSGMISFTFFDTMIKKMLEDGPSMTDWHEAFIQDGGYHGWSDSNIRYRTLVYNYSKCNSTTPFIWFSDLEPFADRHLDVAIRKNKLTKW